jgi:hypothetical protein
MTESELIAEVQTEIKGLSSNYDVSDYAAAVDNAERDTGFTLPVSTAFQIKWVKERVKRHLFFALWVQSSTGFKFKQINLQQKFEQLGKLVEKMDADFEKAQEDYSYEFAQVSASQYFGHKVDAGFAYDELGRDITYDDDQLVNVSPSDSE